MFKHTFNLFNKKEKHYLIFAFFLVLSLTVFYPTLYARAFWDDWVFIFRNDHFFQQSFLSYFPGGANSRSWPVFYTVMKFFLSIFGDNYFFYHLISILLHGANGFLIWKIFNKLKVQFAFWLAILYLVHPFQVFTVGWVIQFKTIMSVFFFLLTLWFLIKFYIEEKYRFLVFSFCFFGLSLLSKSTTVGFIFLVPMFYRDFEKKFGSKKILLIASPFLVLTFCAIVRTIWSYHFAEIFPQLTSQFGKTEFVKGFETQSYSHDTFTDRIVLTFKVLARYLGFLIFPDSNPIFQKKISTSFTSIEFSIIFGTILFLIYTVRDIFNSADKLLRASIVFFLLSLLPFCGFFWIPIFTYSNFIPYWLSVPALGLLPLIPRFIKNGRTFMLLAVIFGTVSFVHSSDLKSTDVVFLNSIKHSPEETIYYVALVEQYVYSADCAGAKRTYDKLRMVSQNKEEALLYKVNRCFQIMKIYYSK
jgi:hypothetical protein